MMDISHLKWAQEHDWFVGYHYAACGLVIQVRDNMEGSTLELFSNFTELRHWAGY